MERDGPARREARRYDDSNQISVTTRSPSTGSSTGCGEAAATAAGAEAAWMERLRDEGAASREHALIFVVAHGRLTLDPAERDLQLHRDGRNIAHVNGELGRVGALAHRHQEIAGGPQVRIQGGSRGAG